jgi:glycosyltransferase XagB
MIQARLQPVRKNVFVPVMAEPEQPHDDLDGWHASLPTLARGKLVRCNLAGVLGTIAFVPVRHADGRAGVVYADTPDARELAARLKARHEAAATSIMLAAPARVQELWAQILGPSLSDFSQRHLTRCQPKMSAGSTLTRTQAMAMAAICVILLGWLLLSSQSLFIAANSVFAAFYLSVAMARILAVMTPLPGSLARRKALVHLPDEALPRYSVLVPIYGEAAMVPQLAHALQCLDYPVDKLDILFLAEADDEPTLAALRAARLPGHMAVIAVPPSQPRTKPKALNVGLLLTRGKFVTVYDAEDRPEPDQLRRAVEAFSAAQKDTRLKLGCVQAALAITNGSSSFFARHFALEYMALFDAFLPAMSQLKLPIPLGGTSNHFPKSALIEVGGWDPYNVTEDADLGIRLARLGYTTQMIASTTYETAPVCFRPWLRQRSRWFKGWWQTWLVHMRQPARLLAELGPWGFVALQTVLLGVLVSVLVHPFFLVTTLMGAAQATAIGGERAAGGSGEILLTLNTANFVLGYAAAVALSGVGAERRAVRGIVPTLLTIPLYWVCLSLAGFMALFELVRRPHHWHKTPHE